MVEKDKKIIFCFVLILFIFQLLSYNITVNKYIQFIPLNLINIYNTLNINNNFNNITEKTVNNSSKCYPIKENYIQYQVKLDNMIYPNKLQLHMNKSIDFKCLNSYTDFKTILVWNTFYGKIDFYYGVGKSTPFIKNNCPVTNCEITNNKSRAYESDLIVFHAVHGIDKFPKYRQRNQKWVFFVYESPVHSSGITSRLNGIFNLTSTYRLDSDINTGYDPKTLFEWGLNETFDENADIYATKSKFAAALISNCNDKSKRLKYIKELNKHITVDLFGKCGKPCPEKDCRELIIREYKFYLSFENSLCKDYITEKFFYMINFNVVPVVLGAGNYSYFVPKSGFINVADYESPKKLADYLKYLDSNKTAYNSYFKWKKHIRLLPKDYHLLSSANSLCDMCIYLQLESYFGVKNKVIYDIDKFWSTSNCHY